MKKLQSHLIGVERGDVALFSDFDSDGEMWTGTGPRERRKKLRFSEPFRDVPSVHVTLSLWDMDSGANIRAEVTSEKVTKHGFDLVFRTWADTRVARVRMSWMAIGELPGEDDWELY
ncbi:H-type lectin domain-containing protein [Salinihabitans flavidus]|uniref:H-type lectin domain-containing protein n=1 Tax=Salinihabitans flavidus TaxID=569882 RepID=A0A1H8SIL4_9RHOB|nr:H-type lectin domain-containing protein [Salinihabitans flavidus]SEO78023.1 H-type lectin domain-containing protein [Salinihabitans flavidus]